MALVGAAVAAVAVPLLAALVGAAAAAAALEGRRRSSLGLGCWLGAGRLGGVQGASLRPGRLAMG